MFALVMDVKRDAVGCPSVPGPTVKVVTLRSHFDIVADLRPIRSAEK
jgi:hypothetical protein